ncbi:energy transducer TonB [Duncaniella freteri]|jgi:protein TonB|uniref:Energy transducer TonB n=10 Tax=Muribaculaceae TaxID=2005473 RepID=A0A4Z0V342_9BACT|nr:energy transducer TonB [Duncaniella freteri]MDE7027888.1 energy transducer TonB [Duncaniella freteri]NBJ05614.1 energy transducer TonB [Alistipes sp. Z76]NCE67619.1 energy transducer TonB [Muribaculaceae bacterium M3]TGG39589.1 energy transducer TonB [Duncaniella freteri]
MAKDVDLSSSEWIDLIFEGKNKNFGAYTLRKASAKRHNRAMLVILVVLFIVALLGLLANTVLQKNDARPEDQVEQALIDYSTEDVEDDEPEEPEQQRVEEQLPEALPEEILNTVKATELAIVRDEEVVEEIKSQDELKDTDTAVGTTDFDKGTDDLNVVREHKNEVIVEEKKPEPVDDNKVFDVVEQKPQFPGGEAALLKYVAEHIRYPAMAQENNIQGRVVVQFVVTKTGAVGEVKVVRGKDPDLDKEAVRVVKSLPKFVPGKMNGHAVNVWYTLPIQFKLQGI